MKDILRIFVGGDRDWRDHDFVEALMCHERKMTPSTTAILWMSGGATGVDTDVKIVCMDRIFPFCEFPAPWYGAGRRAGPIRNSWALKFGQPDLVIGIHNNLDTSKGTKDMLKKAMKKYIEVRLANRIVGYYGAVEITD